MNIFNLSKGIINLTILNKMEKYPSFNKITKMEHNKIENTSCLFEKIRNDYQQKKKNKSYIQSTLFSEGIQQLLMSIISDNKDKEDEEDSNADNFEFCSFDHFKKQFRGENVEENDFFDSLSFEKSVVLEGAGIVDELAGEDSFERSMVVCGDVDGKSVCLEGTNKRNTGEMYVGQGMICRTGGVEKNIRTGSERVDVNYENEEKNIRIESEWNDVNGDNDKNGRERNMHFTGDEKQYDGIFDRKHWGSDCPSNDLNGWQDKGHFTYTVRTAGHINNPYDRCITNQSSGNGCIRTDQHSSGKNIKQLENVHERINKMQRSDTSCRRVISVRLKRTSRNDGSSVKVYKNKKMRLSAVRKVVADEHADQNMFSTAQQHTGRSVLKIASVRNLKIKLKVSAGGRKRLIREECSGMVDTSSVARGTSNDQRILRNKLFNLRREEQFLNKKLTVNSSQRIETFLTINQTASNGTFIPQKNGSSQKFIIDQAPCNDSPITANKAKGLGEDLVMHSEFNTRPRVFKKQGIFLKESRPKRRKSLKINIMRNRKKYQIEFKDDSSVLSSNDKCPEENVPCRVEQVLSEAELVGILRPKTRYFSAMNFRGVKKVAEASFSDVYRYKDKIYKIIPFTEYYTKEEFLREVYVLRTLQNEKYVIKLCNFFVCKGAYNQHLYAAWDAYARDHKSENKRPNSDGRNGEYGCLVMEDAGTDLENYQFKKISDILLFLKIIIECLSILEFKYQFEHRDLHWGNILIQHNNMRNDSLCAFSENVRNFNLSSHFMPEHSVPFKVSIIDFGLSRFSTDHGVVYKDLSPEKELFQGTGDEQYDVYRQMKRVCCNDWSKFNPLTNVMWIKYLVGKLRQKGLSEKLCNMVIRMVGSSGSATELAQQIRSIL